MRKLSMPVSEYFDVRGDEATVTMWYPRATRSSAGASEFSTVVVDLMDVRAADPIRLSYDFDRDGWKVEQQTVFEWDEDEECDPGWVEVSFVKAWASDKRPDKDES